ncbi:MAG: META domain-containing protein [Deltaproteobacteria bacterium]|nr:META domain-containing protein [Deltaproteobacteria bacterium]
MIRLAFYIICLKIPSIVATCLKMLSGFMGKCMNNHCNQYLLQSIVGVAVLFSAVANTIQAMPSTSTEPGDATYSGIYEHMITLKDGRWEGKPFIAGGASRPTVGLVKDFRLTGDLNGDGAMEHVVVLWENSGGTGTQNYLAVMGMLEGRLVNLSTTLIGDRVQLQAGRINNGKIEIDVIQHGLDEPACCPSQKATRIWSLDGKELTLKETLLKGKLSLADLEGLEWVLFRIKRGQALSVKPEVTLRFDGEKIVGKSACNSYFAAVRESGDMAGGISISHVGMTKMACQEEIMNLERRYFEALEEVVKFSFLGGKLALNWKKGETGHTMLFISRKLQSQ